MKEISRAKRQEVVHYYVLGYSYEDIVRETGVSHGSVVNIIKEVEDGRLAIPDSTFDQVNDLRQLSLDLRKKSLEASHALLGLLLFERFRALGASKQRRDPPVSVYGSDTSLTTTPLPTPPPTQPPHPTHQSAQTCLYRFPAVR